MKKTVRVTSIEIPISKEEQERGNFMSMNKGGKSKMVQMVEYSDGSMETNNGMSIEEFRINQLNIK